MQVKKYELKRNSIEYGQSFICSICERDNPLVVEVEINYNNEKICIDCIKKMYDLVAEDIV